MHSENLTLATAIVKALYKDQRGRIWIGTMTGLTCMPIYKTYRHGGAGSLSDSRVTSIMADPRQPDVLWIGTLGGG